MHSHKEIDLTSDQKKLKKFIDEDRYKEAEELLIEKMLDPNFIVSEYADIGEYVREDRYDYIPLIFFSKSLEAISLLLKYGANPYQNGSYTEYDYYGKENRKGVYSILRYWSDQASYPMLVTVLKNQIFAFQNNEINEAILAIFEKFSYDQKKNDCLEAIELLIQASTDLREISDNYQRYGECYSPFSFLLKGASFVKKSMGMTLLLSNNFQLVKDLNASSPFSWYEYQQEKNFYKLYSIDRIQRFFDSIATFQLLQLAMIDKDSKLNELPLEVLQIILSDIIDANLDIDIKLDVCNSFYQSALLMSKVSTFNSIYLKLKDDEPWYARHDFIEKNQHLYPLTFFAKARQHQVIYPDGLTAKTLSLMK